MGTLVYTDVKMYMGPWDISGDLNEVKLTDSIENEEDSTFGASYHTFKPTVHRVNCDYKGFTQFGTGQTTIDGRLINKFAVQDTPILISPEGGDAGELCYFFNSVSGQFERQLVYGKLAKFIMQAKASGANPALVRGTILEDGKTARTSAGVGTAFQVGSVGATQKAYGIFHLLAFSGTSVDLFIQSDTVGFPSANNAFSWIGQTAVGATYVVPFAGPYTDDYWRAAWTGTFSSFNAVIAVGIQ